MYLHFVHDLEIRKLTPLRFSPKNLTLSALRCLFCLGVFFLIAIDHARASDPGQRVWKEQRGTMRAAEIGVVAWKDKDFHSDATAKIFPYVSMKHVDPVTWFYNGVNSKRFEPHQFFQHIKFPQWPPGEIVTQEDFQSLKFKLGELEAFTEKYPNAKAYLAGIIGSMREAAEKFSSGKVFFSGSWINQEEHQIMARLRNEMLHRNSEERRELDKKIQQEAELAKQDAMAQKISKWILGASAAWLLLFMWVLLARSWVWTWILTGSLVAVLGWFTYAESGFGWTKYVLQAINDVPSILMTLKESLMSE
jgi:ABC-type multidrug transport system fused ATPase/permease subunit